ncbi:MAG: nitroreductase family protein [Syntrophales bacterium]
MLEILRKRRSVRRFKKQPLSREQIDALQEAVLRSPSSRAIKPWRFTFVQDAGVIANLARCKEHGSSFLEGAPLAVVVCGDESLSDVWVEDCAIAALIVHLTAVSLGLGGCWIQVRNRMHDAQTTSEEYVRTILGIASPLRVLAIVAVGLPDRAPAGHPFASLDREKIIG